MSDLTKYNDIRATVLNELSQSLSAIDENTVDEFIEIIMSAKKVFFIGVGRVFLSLESIAKRFAHIGIECHLVGEITEPAITKDDVLIVGSGSGNSIVPVEIAKKAKTFGPKIVHIGSNPNGKLKEVTDFMVRIPVRTKEYLDDEIESQQPMTSLFEQSLLLFGDMVAMKIINTKDLDLKGLWKTHANLE